MRVLVLSINYAPELTGIGKYTAEMCAWLARRGHEVRVVTALPYYPEWRIHEGYRHRPPRREHIERVQVERCRLWVPAKPSGAKRIIHLLSFALSSLPRLLGAIGWRPHIVMVIEPPIFCLPGAWLLARLTGATAWLHVQDLEVDAAFELGIVPPVLRKLVMAAERVALSRFDQVSTISAAMRRRLCEKGVSPKRCGLLENWVDCRTIYPLDRPSSYRQFLGITEKEFVALYAGNMGEKQGLEIVVDVARALAHLPDISFVMCGDGAARARLERLAQGAPNIRWLPLQSADRLNDLLNLADVHLLPQRAGAADLVMPSKLLGMMASGRPVLATAQPDSDLAKIVSHVGDVVAPGDTEALVASLLRFRADVSFREKRGHSARCYAYENFAIDSILDRLDAKMRSCICADNSQDKKHGQ